MIKISNITDENNIIDTDKIDFTKKPFDKGFLFGCCMHLDAIGYNDAYDKDEFNRQNKEIIDYLIENKLANENE